MGAGENGAVSATANRADVADRPSNSADSSASSKFANALSQENGNSQVHAGGTKTLTVDNRMMGILNDPRLSGIHHAGWTSAHISSLTCWLESGESPLWGYEPGGPSDSGAHH